MENKTLVRLFTHPSQYKSQYYWLIFSFIKHNYCFCLQYVLEWIELKLISRTNNYIEKILYFFKKIWIPLNMVSKLRYAVEWILIEDRTFLVYRDNVQRNKPTFEFSRILLRYGQTSCWYPIKKSQWSNFESYNKRHKGTLKYETHRRMWSILHRWFI